MNRTIKLAAVLLALLLTVGCAANNKLAAEYVLNYGGAHPTHEDSPIFTVDNVTPYEDLITKTVDIHAFAEQFAPSGDKCINDVQEQFGIECLRETDAGALYSVHKVAQGGLLYVFYNNYERQQDTKFANSSIRRWFYEQKRLSFADIDDLMKPSAPLTAAARVLGMEQIMLNVHKATPNRWLHEEYGLETQHYLEDGIFEANYRMEDGEFVLYRYTLYEDFDLYQIGASRHEPYDAHILEMDWVK
ncbi:MAG: hypothetical protein IJO59_00675 [Clostridia bacterium]|nr:hypothetical protein [Clostridia bacterium]